MTPIYIKLGTEVIYDNERLDFHLDSETPAGILDYNNLNEEIARDLNNGKIVQIDAAEYYSIVGIIVPPIYINPGELSTLKNFLVGCPTDATVFFCYKDNKWWKVLWATLKDCMGGAGGIVTPIHFFVGDPGAEGWHPVATDTEFINADLIGKNEEDLLVLLNGVRLYPKSYYPIARQAEFNWYVVNESDDIGRFEVNLPFADDDLLEIR